MKVKELMGALSEVDQEAELLIFLNEDFGGISSKKPLEIGTPKELDSKFYFAGNEPSQCMRKSDLEKVFIMLRGSGAKD